MTRDTYSIYAYNGLGVGRLRWGKTLSQKRGNPTKTTWKSHNFLQLDNNKTEILVIAAELLWPEIRSHLARRAPHTQPPLPLTLFTRAMSSIWHRPLSFNKTGVYSRACSSLWPNDGATGNLQGNSDVSFVYILWCVDDSYVQEVAMRAAQAAV